MTTAYGALGLRDCFWQRQVRGTHKIKDRFCVVVEADAKGLIVASGQGEPDEDGTHAFISKRAARNYDSLYKATYFRPDTFVWIPAALYDPLPPKPAPLTKLAEVIFLKIQAIRPRFQPIASPGAVGYFLPDAGAAVTAPAVVPLAADGLDPLPLAASGTGLEE